MATASQHSDEQAAPSGTMHRDGHIDPRLVNGWAIDADPENDPTYPMKTHTEGEHADYRWQRPEQQPLDVEVLHSNERPNVTAVFGESVPPQGLSGAIRRWAFRHSESSYAHWLPLMLADRINMVEGVFADFASGRVPNLPAELGWRAEWQHDRKRLVGKVILGGVVITAAAGVLLGLKKRRSS